jgi:DNA-directed RNA polymerase specialized sigma24 family protein
MAINGGEPRRPAAAPALRDIPFEDLFRACRLGGDLSAWNERFGPIVAQVAARVRTRFGNAELADSAALSAVATLVRRLRVGEPDSRLDRIDGPDALVGYLVLRAHHKVWEKLKDRRRLRGWPADMDPAEPGTEADGEPGDADRIRSAVRREMEVQLHRMFERMGLLLGSPRQRATFALIYRDMYGIESLSDTAIADRVGVATKTVQRVRRKVEAYWPEIEAEGRRAVERLEWRLRRLAGL